MSTPLARVAGGMVLLYVLGKVLFSAASAPPPMDDDRAAVDAWMVASRDAFAAGRFDETLAPTQALVDRFPTQQVYLERLALTLQRLDRRAEEADAWRRFMEHSPTPWEACPAIARARAAAGDEAGAFADYERCYAIEPKNPDAAFFLGQARERRGDLAGAEAMFRTALSLAPDHADAHLKVGIIEFAAGNRAAARGHFDTFVELSPQRRDEVAVWLERTEPRR